jgi:hypothetical protein
MLLSAYLALTRSLFQTPQSPIPLITDGLLTNHVNIARQQLALDAECVRFFGTATVAAGRAILPVTDISLGTTEGAQPVVVRNATLAGVRVDIRPWDWYAAYHLNPPAGPVPVMSHQGQGTFSVLYISSQAGGLLEADVVCLPDWLLDESSIDQIPYPFTDAVPFYAAYYAYMSMQRQADANLMLARYHEVVRRGRTGVTSTNLPGNDPGGPGTTIAGGMQTSGAPPAAAPTRGGR